MFRRQCYEAVGGYVPIKEGGVDFVAVTTARMKGWMTRTFTEKTCLHHRKMGTGNTDSLMRFFRHGTRDYSFGNHPLWEVFRVLYQMSRKPYFVRGVLLFLGYMEAWLRKADKRVSRELVEFIRAEQMERLQRKLLRL